MDYFVANTCLMTTETTSPELPLDIIQLKKASLVFRAVNHKLRQDLLRLIHSEGRMTVTNIFIKLRLEQSVVSQHLALLRKAGFVNTEREGKYIFYSLNYRRMEELQEYATVLTGVKN